MFKHFTTVEAFDTYLHTIQKPSWLKRIVIHHTYTPTVEDWNGLKTMQGMYTYYKSLGWTGYPHVFVAPDGLWIMNPLTSIGIHANAANIDSYGFEIVGRYDTMPWQEPIKSFAVKSIAKVVKWANIPLSNIVPHRQFNPLKTCPGKAITMPWVRRLVELENAHRYTVIVDVANIREDSSTNDVIKFKVQRGDTIISTALKVDTNGHKDSTGNIYKWANITAIITRDGFKNIEGYIRTDLVSENS